MHVLFLQGFTSISPLGLALCLLLLEGLDAHAGSWLINCLIEVESPHGSMSSRSGAPPVVSMVCRVEVINKVVSEAKAARSWQSEVKEGWAGPG